jgi:hypothetical protein
VYGDNERVRTVRYKNKEDWLHGLKVKGPWSASPGGSPLPLQADGWYLRQDIIWHKPNPMPESVTDRCTKSHEYIFLLTKSAKYYYDNEAVKEPLTCPNEQRSGRLEVKGAIK